MISWKGFVYKKIFENMMYFDNKKVLVYKNIFWFSLIYDKMLTKHLSIERFFQLNSEKKLTT